MKNVSRVPTFGDFVTIRKEASMQDVTVARLQSTRVQTPLSPVMYCVRVSLCTVKIFCISLGLCECLRRKSRRERRDQVRLSRVQVRLIVTLNTKHRHTFLFINCMNLQGKIPIISFTVAQLNSPPFPSPKTPSNRKIRQQSSALNKQA
jgi:hypothetical protein